MDKNNKTVNYLIYGIIGIYNDYLIDTNLILSDSLWYSYETFRDFNKWEVAIIRIEDRDFLILDIDIHRFSYCRYIRHQKRVLKTGLKGEDALDELNAYSKFLNKPVLDQLEYYLRGKPKILKDIYMPYINREQNYS